MMSSSVGACVWSTNSLSSSGRICVNIRKRCIPMFAKPVIECIDLRNESWKAANNESTSHIWCWCDMQSFVSLMQSVRITSCRSTAVTRLLLDAASKHGTLSANLHIFKSSKKTTSMACRSTSFCWRQAGKMLACLIILLVGLRIRCIGVCVRANPT